MGGFHGGHSSGGHSSGGGFHGGHHSSSHSYHGGSHSSYHVHTVVHGHHYINGKRYYGPNYGMNGSGKVISFFTSLLIGIIFLLVGIGLYVLMATPKTATATITNTWIASDGYEKYEGYDFEYSYGGKTYTGYGDDDLAYDGSYTINVGEKYTLYLHVYSNSSYSFKNNTDIAVVLGLIFGGVGLLLTLNTLRIHIKYKKKLQEIGDINGDGKLDEADIEYAEKLNHGKADGAYDGAREATAYNTYNEIKKDFRKVCPYCGSYANPTDSFCTNCGGRLSEETKSE